MNARLPALVAALALLVFTGRAVAHHSFSAEFDADLPIELTGVVTKIEWTNPHVWFFLDVTDEDGDVASWGWEMGSPNGLMRNGWTLHSMNIGDVLTVEGWRAKDLSNRANARTVLLTSTGERLFAGSNQGQAQ